ncbi:hypothetical protein [Rhizobium sullae]|uniref:Histidine kinase n=1 Tax=Rhizobium sullae TaxID=50338 RepID=A0A2N0D5H2_RHISU|nr:hypothetical protein [Rhizobium sullae]PKA41340.1 hypothetical protein CWR43_24335 [Rhizobium sullae]UWU12954.1 hypothetical protein N2599_12325 [Rhizobium sullae]
MQFSVEAAPMEPSEPAIAERRALIDHLRAVIANLAHGLAADGQLELVPLMLEINEVLRDLTDEISHADAAYSDEIIAGTVRLIRTSHALLDDEVIAQTIH